MFITSQMIQRWARTVGAVVAIALATGCAAGPAATPSEWLGLVSPTSPPSPSLATAGPKLIERAQAIVVAEHEAAGNSATAPVLLEANRGVLNCRPQPCPEVWTVSFAVTDKSGKRGHTTVQIDATSGTLMYSDWSWP
jgi:hypothetical protein